MIKGEGEKLKMLLFIIIALAVSFYFDVMVFLIVVAFSLSLLLYEIVNKNNKRLNRIERMLVENKLAEDTDFDEQEEV